MGNCVKPKPRNQGSSRRQQKSINYYKAKTSSNHLVCYQPDKQSFWEIAVSMNGMFQPGCLVATMSSGKMLFIGGTESDVSFQVDLEKKTAVQIKSPPMNLAYGSLHVYQNDVYVIGSISIESAGTEVPPLLYRIQTNNWHELPAMPTPVALPGSFLINQTIYVIGGFLNYPNSPVPFKSVLQFDILKKSWGLMNIETPIRHGLPACAVVSDNEILIVGGHDPLDNYDSEESRRTYLFDLNQFQQMDDLPETGQLHFTDPPVRYFDEVLLFSDDEMLFKFNLKHSKWSVYDTEVDPAPGPAPGVAGNYVYHYLQEECSLYAFDIDRGEARLTGPSSFHHFYRHSGFCILADGKLFFAGGKLDDQPTSSCWMLDPSVRQPLPVADLPFPQYGVRLVLVGRTIYGVAGLELVAGQNVARCQRYSIDEQTWTSIEPMPYPTLLPGCCYFAGKVFCVGGMVNEGGSCNLYLIQAYTPDRHWAVLPVEYPIGVVSPGVFPVSGNKLLCFGGTLQTGSVVRNAYVFDGQQFAAQEALPETEEREDSTAFEDPIVRSDDCVYAFSKAGMLFSYDLQQQHWTRVQLTS